MQMQSCVYCNYANDIRIRELVGNESLLLIDSTKLVNTNINKFFVRHCQNLRIFSCVNGF
jgi:hypothetical protein